MYGIEINIDKSMEQTRESEVDLHLDSELICFKKKTKKAIFFSF